MGFLQGRPWPRFIAGLIGLVGFQGTFRVGKGASSSFSLIGVSIGVSSLSGLTLQLSLGQKQGFTDVLLNLVSPLRSYTQHVLFSTASKQQGPVHLPLLRHIRTLELSGRLYTKVVLGPLQWFKALLTVYLARSLTISAIAFYIIAAYSIIDGARGSRLLILRQAPQTKRVGTSPSGPAVLLMAFMAIYRASSFQMPLYSSIIIQQAFYRAR